MNPSEEHPQQVTVPSFHSEKGYLVVPDRYKQPHQHSGSTEGKRCPGIELLGIFSDIDVSVDYGVFSSDG